MMTSVLSLTDDVRVVIYNCNMFIMQATGFNLNVHIEKNYLLYLSFLNCFYVATTHSMMTFSITALNVMTLRPVLAKHGELKGQLYAKRFPFGMLNKSIQIIMIITAGLYDRYIIKLEVN
jgi:hypothetical protein